MPFDATRYLAARLQPRTAVVQVPALAAFFGDGESAEWTVRGLDANALARVREAFEKRRNAGALLEALISDDTPHRERVKAIQAELGYADDVHADTSRRIQLLVEGSVTPECPRELAVRLGRDFPVIFFELTNRIMELSGQGADDGKKPVPSGETAKSAPA